jgi:hypothetical protein
MTEDELRELRGYGGPPEITFAGEQWKIRPDGLAPLLRYTLADRDEGSEWAALNALYRLLEDCITDFPAFSYAATSAKAEVAEMQSAAEKLFEFYCARNFWPASRLIGIFGGRLDEIDGQLLRSSGRGVASLSAREACNLTLAICLEGRDEDSREEFFIDLEYEGNPDQEALALVRQMKADRAAAAEGADDEGGLG